MQQLHTKNNRKLFNWASVIEQNTLSQANVKGA